jgi:hypothetical protein
MRFAPPKFTLGPLLFVNIEIGPNPKQQCSVRAPYGFGSTQKPPVLPFRIAGPKGYFARTAGA